MPEMKSDRPPGTRAPGAGGAGEAAESQGPGQLAERVRERVTSELNSRKDRASEMLQDLAGTVRQVGEPLREGALAPLAEYADEAASRLGELAADMRERDVEELAGDLRDLARRRPAAFAAAGFAAGLLAARFFKSTAAPSPTSPGPSPRPGVQPRVERRVKQPPPEGDRAGSEARTTTR